MQEQKLETNKEKKDVAQIVSKISVAENILIALSQNPTADELSAAIGLSLYLDKAGKHATAIYSGKTPSILEFLDPERRLETNTDSLQDFIIAINKDKADHLRYKVEGDYVKVYITPYKTKISEEDLEFSHGDFNIDLVVSLNVPNANSLDKALSNHGRILHDAETINITTNEPGDFGNIQWSDLEASSISEMIAELAFRIEEETGNNVDGEITTALLTGIFVATDRFSNERTKPETMTLAAKLMSLGADQKLISEYMRKSETQGGENAFSDTQVNQVQVEASDKSTEIDVEKKETQDGIPEELVGEQDIEVSHNNENLENKEQEEKDSPKVEVDESEQRIESSEPPVGNTVSIKPINERVASNLADNSATRLKPLSYGGNTNGLGADSMKAGGTSPGLPAVNMDLGYEAEPKTNLAQVATPFEETPAPSFVDQKDTNILGSPSPQPVFNSLENPGVKLSGMGAQSSVDESVMNDLRNYSDNPIPLGKDYDVETTSETASTLTNDGTKGTDGNPAIGFAPKVSEGPEENYLPGLDFSSPVSMSEDEPSVGGQDNSFLVETKPAGGVQNSIPNATLEPKSQGMPLPGDEILPPPPTPPVDFSSVGFEKSTVPNNEKPVSSESVSFLNLGQSDNKEGASQTATQPFSQTTPGIPQVDQNLTSNTMPTSGAQNPPAMQQPFSSDPGAFKIPGM